MKMYVRFLICFLSLLSFMPLAFADKNITTYPSDDNVSIYNNPIYTITPDSADKMEIKTNCNVIGQNQTVTIKIFFPKGSKASFVPKGEATKREIFTLGKQTQYDQGTLTIITQPITIKNTAAKPQDEIVLQTEIFSEDTKTLLKTVSFKFIPEENCPNS